MINDENKIFQLYVESYTTSTIQRLVQKFQDAQPGLSQDNIEFYIKRFDQIKTSSKLAGIAFKFGIKNPRDITLYSWKQLEQVVDQFPARSKEHIERHADNADLIYNQNGIEVYKADTKEKCIYYGQQHFGQQYTFCISRTKDGNMYDDYRLNGRTFYFVRDNDVDQNKFQSDQNNKFIRPMHLQVIHATTNPNIFYVTLANNDGDAERTWEDIEVLYPKLKGLKELFKFVPFNDKEKDYIRKTRFKPRDFNILPDDLKKEYIEMGLMINADDYPHLSEEMEIEYVKRHGNLANFLLVRGSPVLITTACKLLEYGTNKAAILMYRLTCELGRKRKEGWEYTQSGPIYSYREAHEGIRDGACYMVSPNPRTANGAVTFSVRKIDYDNKSNVYTDWTGHEYKVINSRFKHIKTAEPYLSPPFHE